MRVHRAEPDITLYDHATALARQYSGVPLPNEGMPYPNTDEYAVSDESSTRAKALTTQLGASVIGTVTGRSARRGTCPGVRGVERGHQRGERGAQQIGQRAGHHDEPCDGGVGGGL